MTVRILLFLLLLSQVVASMDAGANEWTGATSLDVLSIRIHPNRPSRLYLATENGVFATEDEGNTYIALRNGLSSGDVDSLEFDPQNPDIVYALVYGGLFRSTNGGHDWRLIRQTDGAELLLTPRDSGVLYLLGAGREWRILKSIDGGRTWTTAEYTPPVHCLAISPSNPQIMYGGTSKGEVWRSDDGGEFWLRASSATSNAVNRIVVDPRNPDTVYQAPYDKGLLKSMDRGATWRRISDGISLYSHTISDLIVSPTDSNHMVALCHGSIYRSLNGGETWRHIRQSGIYMRAIARSPAAEDLFYAAGEGRLYKTAAGGTKLVPTEPSLPGEWQQRLLIAPKNPDRMYVLRSQGLSRSEDGGRSWRHLDAALPDGYLTEIEVDPRDPDVLFLGVPGAGVYRSVDAGESWHRVLTLPDNDEYEDSWSVAVDPHRPGHLFAVRRGGGYDNTPYIYRSANSGQTWAPAYQGLPFGQLKAFVFDAAPGAVYVGHVAGVFKSTNDGETWLPASALSSGQNLPETAALAADPRNPNVLYCAAFDGGVFKTTDGGLAWFPIGLQGGLPDDTVNRLTVSPHDSTIYALSYGQALTYRSTDGGGNWTSMPSGFRWPTFAPDDPDVLFNLGEVVYKSVDRGQQWYPILYDLRGTRVMQLALDPTDSSVLFALADDVGVYRSVDGSRTWEAAGQGLSGRLSDLVIDPFDNSVLLAAGSDGIFRSNDAGRHWENAHGAKTSSIVVDPSRSGVFYALSRNSRTLYRTLDGGDAWQQIAPGYAVSTIAISRSTPEVLFAGGDKVLIKSTDSGSTWAELNWGSARLPIDSIEVDPEDEAAVRILGCVPIIFEGPLPCQSYQSRDGGQSWTLSQAVRSLERDPLNPYLLYSPEDLRVTFDGGADWVTISAPPAHPQFTQSQPRMAYSRPNLGVFALTLPQEEVAYFPQVGSGRSADGELQTEFLFMNLGETAEVVQVDFFGADGEPMPVALGQLGTQVSFSISLERGETVSLQTGDTGPLQVGSARVRSAIQVRSTAIYGYREQGTQLFEAGVALSDPLRDCTVFVSGSAEGLNTGLAIVNAGEEAALVTLRLYDRDFNLLGSRQLADAVGPLPPHAHTAQFVAELFPELAAVEVKDGLLTLESDQPIAVASLLQTRSERSLKGGGLTLTSMPVLEGRPDGASPASHSFPRRLYLPQVASGRAAPWQMQSSLLFANPGSSPASVKVQFFDPGGRPMAVPLLGDDDTPATEVNLVLESGRSARVASDGHVPLQAGYAVVTVDGDAGAAAVYHGSQAGIPLFDAGLPIVWRYPRQALFASVTGNQNTALALLNTGTEAAHAVATLYGESGTSLGEANLSDLAPLPPGGRIARYLSELFPGVQVANGRITIESDQPLAGVTLRHRDDPGIPYPLDIYLLTVFPVFPLP